VYERNGEYAGVLGPGMHYLNLDESVRKVIVTYQRAGSSTLKEIMTKDGIPVTVEYSVSYRIESRTEPEIGKPYPYSEEACMKAAYNAPNWESKIINGAGGLIATKIAGMTLDELFDLRNATTYPIGDMLESLRMKLQERTRRYGAVILGLDIDKVDLPASVREQMLARWRMHVEAQLRMELSAKALRLVAEQTGQIDPQVTLQLLDHVIGLGKLESLNLNEYTDIKREMERRLFEEMALQETLTRPRSRAAISSTAPTPR
jgi:regulator of protease activity HflC (stomatin/prohibitin superfamily)